MRIEKIIEDDISLSTEDLTSGDINGTIMRKLKEKYEGRCWDNVYVLTVKSVVKRNAIKMSQSMIDGHGNTNAQFLVDAIELVPGDILVGCKIIEIEKHSVILCDHEYASVTIGDKFLSPKKGQMLFVQVDQSSYLTNEDKISVRSSPFVIDDKKLIYVMSDKTDLSNDEKMMLEKALQRVDNAKARVSKQGKSTSDFFEDLLYPYKNGSTKTTPKKLTPKGSNLVDAVIIAKDMIAGKKTAHGAYLSHPAVNMTTSSIYQLPESWNEKLRESAAKEDISNTYVMDKTAYDVVLKVLYEHSIYLNAIADMCDTYATEKLRKSHDNIWESYRRIKIPM